MCLKQVAVSAMAFPCSSYLCTAESTACIYLHALFDVALDICCVMFYVNKKGWVTCICTECHFKDSESHFKCLYLVGDSLCIAALETL